jgi:hypothetical protein
MLLPDAGHAPSTQRVEVRVRNRAQNGGAHGCGLHAWRIVEHPMRRHKTLSRDFNRVRRRHTVPPLMALYLAQVHARRR